MAAPALSQTFYDAMGKNRWRTALLFSLFPPMMLAILYLGSYLAAAYGMAGPGDTMTQAGDLFFTWSPWIILGSVVWMLVMVLGGKRMILSLSGAKPIKKADAPELYRLVENLAIRTGIKTPEVYIMEDDSMNAFATGFSPDKAAVTVTRGLLNKLQPSELEAVLAHEFGHILNRDIRVMLIAITLVGIIQLLADVILRSLWYSGRRRSSNDRNDNGGLVLLAILAVWIIGFIGSILVQLGISRRREYLADAESAYLTRNPSGLISALQKITSDPRVEQLDGKRSIAALCIADPLEDGAGKRHFLDSLQGLFSIHSSTKDRIAELQRMGM
jgi:heat shock protein HtpX